VRQAFIVGQAQPGRHGHPPPSAYEQGRCSAGLRELGDEEAASTTRDAIDHPREQHRLVDRRPACDPSCRDIPAGAAITAVEDRPRQSRVMLHCYLAPAAAAVIVGLVWVLPSVLTEHPSIADAVDRHKAITDTRTGLVAILAAIGAAGGLAFTARTYRLGVERLSRQFRGWKRPSRPRPTLSR
jgi:hypothetical protein